jgi:hypothetical protein
MAHVRVLARSGTGLICPAAYVGGLPLAVVIVTENDQLEE